MTKPPENSDESRLEVRPAHGKYLFVYPFVKVIDAVGVGGIADLRNGRPGDHYGALVRSIVGQQRRARRRGQSTDG
jgi:hypothetical protein